MLAISDHGQVVHYSITGRLRLFLLLLALLLLTSGIALAESPWTTRWDVTGGGLADDACFAIVDAGDGYVVAGLTNSSTQGGYDVSLAKYNDGGNRVWSMTYGGFSDDMALALDMTSDGGFILAGGTQSYGSGGMDVYLIRTDKNGKDLWTRTFGGVFWDCGYSVRETSDGGFIVAADTRSAGNGEQDAWLIRTDAGGNMLWNRTYGGAGIDIARSVRQMPDGGYAFAGMTESYGNGGFDVYLVRTDDKGAMQWMKTFGGPKDDIARALEITADGGFIVAGLENSYGNGGYDAFLIKTDAGGNVQWSKTYGGPLDDLGRSVSLTPDSGYLLAGDAGSYGNGKQDYYIVRTDADGNVQWSKTYGGAGDDVAESAIVTRDGSVVVAGNTQSRGAGGQDMYLIRLATLNTDSLLPESSLPILSIALGTSLGALSIVFNQLIGFLSSQLEGMRARLGLGSQGDEIFKIGKSHVAKAFSDKEKNIMGVIAERGVAVAFGLSRNEIRVAVASALVLGLATMYTKLGLTIDPVSVLEFVLIAGIAAVAHDLGHRFVAGRFNAETEYKFWKIGTLIVIATSLLHMPFAQPSRTIINEPRDPDKPRLTLQEKGLIYLAGPAVSFGFVLLFAAMIPLGGTLADIGVTGISLNLLAAVYNLMPFWPMDGDHIRKWNPGLYLLIFLPSLALFLVILYQQLADLLWSLLHALGV